MAEPTPDHNSCCYPSVPPLPSGRLRGIIPPLVTPLLEVGGDTTSTRKTAIDEVGTKKLIDHVVEGGCSAIFALGSTGEAPSLSHAMRKQFAGLCCRSVGGRLPVLVGILDTCLDEAVELAEVARRAGASALVLTAPYYYDGISQSELADYVRSVAARTNHMPLFLYNMPGLTKVWFEVETVRELMVSVPEIRGIKDSSGDVAYLGQMCELRDEHRPDDFSVLLGPEQLAVEALVTGQHGNVDGVVPSTANVEPRLLVSLYDACVRAAARRRGKHDGGGGGDDDDHDDDDYKRQEERLLKLLQILEVGSSSSPPWFAAVKCACAARGLLRDDAALAPPFPRCDESERKRIKQVLDDLDLDD